MRKALKKIDRAGSLLMVITPFYMGFAEDFGKNGNRNKLHKKVKVQINYD